MGKLLNTKKIIVLMLVLFGLSSALRLGNRQEGDTGVDIPEQPATPPTDESPAATVTITQEEDNFFSSVESRTFYETHVYSLGQSIVNDGENFYQTTVHRTSDEDSEESEENDIQYPRTNINNRVREEYRRVRDRFDFSFANIYVFEGSFWIILATENGDVTVDRSDLRSFLGTDGRYEDILEDLFNYRDTSFSVADATFIYYIDREDGNIDSQEYNVAISTTGGDFQAQALPLELRSILIKRPQNTDLHGSWYSFQFALELDNTNFLTARTEGMSGLVPFYCDIWSDRVRDIDIDNPELRFDISPVGNQIDVDLLISLLDQDNAIDQRVSPQLGEDDSAPFDTTVNIPAPKGLDTFNHLPVSSAFFNISGGSLAVLAVTPTCPDFAFLPLEMVTSANNCDIIYVSSNNVAVEIQGQVLINGQYFISYFRKTSEQTVYNITLFGQEGTSMTFADIKTYLFSTMEVRYTSTVLTTDSDSLARFAEFGIDEDSTLIENPVIDVSYETYLMYSVRGRYSFGDGLGNRIAFSGDFINLDGAVLSYARFFFNPSISPRRFQQFFNIQGNQDAGLTSFRILDFELISVNRDFNIDSITQMRHSNLMIYTDLDVLTRNGLSIVLETDLDYNCDNNDFCRMFKGFGVPSALNFTGVIGEHETILSTDFSNFTLNEVANYEHNSFSIRISPDGEEGNSANLIFNGELLGEFEPEGRTVRFDTTWTFPNNPTGVVALAGTKTSIYDNIFGLEIFDILEGVIDGTINPVTNVINFDYRSTSIVGTDCYTHPEYINWVVDDDNTPESYIYNYDNEDQNENGTLDVISDSCVVGNSDLRIFSDDHTHNRFDSQFYFEGYEDFIRTVFNTQPEDHVSLLVDHIEFPRGLTTNNVYREVTEQDYIQFYGTGEFLGITGYDMIQAYPEEERAISHFYFPSVTFGGSNLQLLSDAEINRVYPTDGNRYCRGRLDCRDASGSHIGNEELFEQNNTLTLEFDTQNMAATDIHISSNMVIFEILQRVEYSLSQERWDFAFNGKPYRGAFDAEVVVEIVPVPDIQHEDNSIVRVVLDQTDNFFRLQTLVNEEMQRWASNLINSRLSSEQSRHTYNHMREVLVLYQEQYTDCAESEQCQDLPQIRCTEYAQNAVCIEEAQVCSQVTQSCVSRETHTYDWGTFEVCTEFETVCEDGDEGMNTVCLDYDLQDVPDECVAMELSCTRVMMPDENCIETYQRLQEQIDFIDGRLAHLDELDSLLQPLQDSAACMIRLDSEEREQYPDCTTRDDTLEGIPEQIEILQFFSLRDTRSIMSLRDIVSSDSMIFESDISLYGDWTRGQSDDDRTIVRNNLDDSREDEDRGYDVGVESLFYINHYIDFNSINQTSVQIYESIKQIVCRENNVQGERSSRVQVLMREFGLLEGNRTFCPDLETISNDRFVEVDQDLRVNQASIYSTYTSDEEYVSSTFDSDDEATLRFRYSPSEEVVEASRVRESYDQREQYGPADTLPNSVIDRVDDETIAETEALQYDQQDRIEQEVEEQQYVDEVQQQWTDEANHYEEDQGGFDDVVEDEQEEIEESLEEVEEEEAEAEELQQVQEEAEESIEAAQEQIEEANEEIEEMTGEVENVEEEIQGAMDLNEEDQVLEEPDNAGVATESE